MEDGAYSVEYFFTTLRRSIKTHSSTRTALTTIALGAICIAVFMLTVLREENAPLTKLPISASCADAEVCLPVHLIPIHLIQPHSLEVLCSAAPFVRVVLFACVVWSCGMVVLCAVWRV